LNTFGVTFHDSVINKQGIFFAKIDTNGTILNTNTFFDALGDDYATRLGSSIIKLNSGLGFVVPGVLLQRANGFLLFIDNDGNKVNFREYADTSTILDIYEKIFEVNNGFVVCGTKIRNDYSPCVFIAKMDFDGIKLWEKTYASQSRDWYYNSVYLETPNSYILGISSVPPLGTPVSSLNSQTVMLAIDSIGSEMWRWESIISLDEGGAGALQKTVDDNWIYLSARADLNVSQNSWTLQPKVIVRDINFDLIWEKTFGLSNSNENQLTCLNVTHDNNWVASGFMKNPQTPNTLSGSINKFTNTGDSIWSRYDTVIYYATAYTSHSISGTVVLPSGSIITCGSVDDYSNLGKSYAWLLKINKNGCIDTLNCIISHTYIYDGNSNISVFPNPTTSKAYFNSSDNLNLEAITILNSSGIVIKTIFPNEINEIDLSELSTGMYTLQFRWGNKILIKKIIKL
jgi:hypothetical protein